MNRGLSLSFLSCVMKRCLTRRRSGRSSSSSSSLGSEGGQEFSRSSCHACLSSQHIRTSSSSSLFSLHPSSPPRASLSSSSSERAESNMQPVLSSSSFFSSYQAVVSSGREGEGQTPNGALGRSGGRERMRHLSLPSSLSSSSFSRRWYSDEGRLLCLSLLDVTKTLRVISGGLLFLLLSLLLLLFPPSVVFSPPRIGSSSSQEYVLTLLSSDSSTGPLYPSSSSLSHPRRLQENSTDVSSFSSSSSLSHASQSESRHVLNSLSSSPVSSSLSSSSSSSTSTPSPLHSSSSSSTSHSSVPSLFFRHLFSSSSSSSSSSSTPLSFSPPFSSSSSPVVTPHALTSIILLGPPSSSPFLPPPYISSSSSLPPFPSIDHLRPLSSGVSAPPQSTLLYRGIVFPLLPRPAFPLSSSSSSSSASFSYDGVEDRERRRDGGERKTEEGDVLLEREEEERRIEEDERREKSRYGSFSSLRRGQGERERKAKEEEKKRLHELYSDPSQGVFTPLANQTFPIAVPPYHLFSLPLHLPRREGREEEKRKNGEEVEKIKKDEEPDEKEEKKENMKKKEQDISGTGEEEEEGGEEHEVDGDAVLSIDKMKKDQEVKQVGDHGGGKKEKGRRERRGEEERRGRDMFGPFFVRVRGLIDPRDVPSQIKAVQENRFFASSSGNAFSPSSFSSSLEAIGKKEKGRIKQVQGEKKEAAGEKGSEKKKQKEIGEDGSAVATSGLGELPRKKKDEDEEEGERNGERKETGLLNDQEGEKEERKATKEKDKKNESDTNLSKDSHAMSSSSPLLTLSTTSSPSLSSSSSSSSSSSPGSTTPTSPASSSSHPSLSAGQSFSPVWLASHSVFPSSSSSSLFSSFVNEGRSWEAEKPLHTAQKEFETACIALYLLPSSTSLSKAALSSSSPSSSSLLHTSSLFSDKKEAKRNPSTELVTSVSQEDDEREIRTRDQGESPRELRADDIVGSNTTEIEVSREGKTSPFSGDESSRDHFLLPTSCEEAFAWYDRQQKEKEAGEEEKKSRHGKVDTASHPSSPMSTFSSSPLSTNHTSPSNSSSSSSGLSSPSVSALLDTSASLPTHALNSSSSSRSVSSVSWREGEAPVFCGPLVHASSMRQYLSFLLPEKLVFSILSTYTITIHSESSTTPPLSSSSSQRNYYSQPWSPSSLDVPQTPPDHPPPLGEEAKSPPLPVSSSSLTLPAAQSTLHGSASEGQREKQLSSSSPSTSPSSSSFPLPSSSSMSSNEVEDRSRKIGEKNRVSDGASTKSTRDSSSSSVPISIVSRRLSIGEERGESTEDQAQGRRKLYEAYPHALPLPKKRQATESTSAEIDTESSRERQKRRNFTEKKDVNEGGVERGVHVQREEGYDRVNRDVKARMMKDKESPFEPNTIPQAEEEVEKISSSFSSLSSASFPPGEDRRRRHLLSSESVRIGLCYRSPSFSSLHASKRSSLAENGPKTAGLRPSNGGLPEEEEETNQRREKEKKRKEKNSSFGDKGREKGSDEKMTRRQEAQKVHQVGELIFHVAPVLTLSLDDDEEDEDEEEDHAKENLSLSSSSSFSTSGLINEEKKKSSSSVEGHGGDMIIVDTSTPLDIGRTAESSAWAARVYVQSREKETVHVRRFINAGWEYTRDISGYNVTGFNRLVLKSVPRHSKYHCPGFWEQHAFIGVGPSFFSLLNATSTSFPSSSSQLEGLRFEMEEKYHEESKSALFDGGYVPSPYLRTFACFYANEADPQGIPIAEVLFFMDSKDAISIVFFILSLVVGIPVCCGISLSCHALKHRKLRRGLRRLQLVRQRDTIELHLLQELGVSPTIEEEEEEEEEEDDGLYSEGEVESSASCFSSSSAVLR